MARYRIELATIIELFADVDSMADAQQFALDFITQHAVSSTPRYKLHAIYDTSLEVPSEPSPRDALMPTRCAQRSTVESFRGGRLRKHNPGIPKHIDQTKLPLGIYWNNVGKGRWYVFVDDPDGPRTTKVVAGHTARLSDLHAIMEERAGKGAVGQLAM